ncbi:MAG: translation initiation factor IF-3 [Pseudomonadota bacterium]
MRSTPAIGARSNKRGDCDIPRRPRRFAPERENKGPKTNEDIAAETVQLIDAEGTNVGPTPRADALEQAAEAGLDLVEISPNAEPPVCKIMDYGKHKYQAQKKANEARKKQKTFEVKEIKMRPNIDTHDYDVKMRAMHKFFDQGDKVKVTMRFRGREMAHQNLGLELLHRVRDEVEERAKVEAEAKMEGRQMIMVLAPR